MVATTAQVSPDTETIAAEVHGTESGKAFIEGLRNAGVPMA